MEFELLSLAKDVGVLAALVIFFIWRDSKREARLVDRIEALETWCRQELAELVTETQKVIGDNTAAWKELKEKLEEK